MSSPVSCDRNTIGVLVSVNATDESIQTVNYPPDVSYTTWNVSSLRDDGILNGRYHFELRNALNSNCDGCATNSDIFVVMPRIETTSTSQMTASTSSSTVSAGSSSTMAAVVHTFATGSATTVSTVLGSESHRTDNTLQIALGAGIGMGVGIPIVVAVFVALEYCMRRRRNQRRDGLPRGRQPSRSPSSDWRNPWISQDPYDSQQTLARPPSAATSEGSIGNLSWIEPLEQVEMRENDAMAQFRQSRYGSPRPRVSDVSFPDTYLAGSDLEGIPESPQPVHNRRWSGIPPRTSSWI